MELISEFLRAFRNLGLLPWTPALSWSDSRTLIPGQLTRGSLAPDLAAQLCPLNSLLASGPDFPGNLNPAMPGLDFVTPNLSLKPHGALLFGGAPVILNAKS